MKHADRAYSAARCNHWIKDKNPDHPAFNPKFERGAFDQRSRFRFVSRNSLRRAGSALKRSGSKLPHAVLAAAFAVFLSDRNDAVDTPGQPSTARRLTD
jgi:hypothetical protein